MLRPAFIPRKSRVRTVVVSHSLNFDTYELLDDSGCTFAKVVSATFDEECQVDRAAVLLAFSLLIPATDTLTIREDDNEDH